MNNVARNIIVWLVIALLMMAVFNQFGDRRAAQSQVEYSQFIDEVKAGRVAKVTIEGQVIRGMRTDQTPFTTYAPSDPWMVSDLLKSGVKVEAKPQEEPSFLVSLLVSWFPMLLLIGVWVYFTIRTSHKVIVFVNLRAVWTFYFFLMFHLFPFLLLRVCKQFR